jgi:hypothetical protein
MAIKINTVLDSGIKSDNSYSRIESLQVSKDTISFSLRRYTEIGKPFFFESSYTAPYSLDKENPFKQAYEHLKTLPEFADAVDV